MEKDIRYPTAGFQGLLSPASLIAEALLRLLNSVEVRTNLFGEARVVNYRRLVQ